MQRLLHIKRYCEDIAEFIDRFGNDFRTFTEDRAYFNAVAMSIMQIGELANGLSDEFRDETRERIPWGLVRGMRNWIAHSYNKVEDEVIWDTILKDIPLLLKFCDDVTSNK